MTLPPLKLRAAVAAATLLTLLPASAADISATYTWKPVTIGGGGFVTGLIQHPDTGAIYCRTDVGGAFRWTESTKRWSTIMPGSGIPAEFRSNGFYNVDGMATSKQNPGTLYMAIGAQNPRSSADLANPKGAIIKSTDNGLTWTAASSKRWVVSGNGWYRTGGERLAVDPANGNVVYFGTRAEGLWRSENGGGSWTQVSTSVIPVGALPSDSRREPSGVKPVLFDSSQGLLNGRTKRIWVGVAGEGIYRSDDAGATFTKVYNSTLVPFDMEVTSTGVLWVGFANNGSGSGMVANWNPSTNTWRTPTPTGDADFTIAIDPFNENRVFVTCGGVANQKIARTTIGTDTQWWTFMNIAGDYPDIQWPRFTDELNFMTVGDIKFDRVTENRLWFAQGIGVWRSSDLADSELTWTFVTQGIEEFIGQDIITTPSGMLLTAVADRLGFRHSNGPDADPGAPIITNRFSSVWSLDWTPANSQFVAAIETDHRYNSERNLWVSTNNGLNWTKKSNPMNLLGGEIAVSATSTSNMVWVGVGPVNPRVTTDGGTNWTELTFFNNLPFRDDLWWASRRALASDRVDGGVFYLHLPSGPVGRFYRSSNQGRDWVQTAGALPSGWGDGNLHSQIEAVPGRAGHVWGCFNQHGVHYTTNAGDSFTKVPFFNFARAIGFGKQIAGGTYHTVFVWGNTTSDPTYSLYRSIDQGATWDKIVTYPLGLFDSMTRVTGDLQNDGRVYVAVGGSGMVYGQPANGGGGGNGTTGSITRDVWNNITGTQVSDIPLTSPPSSTGTLSSFEAPSNVADNYGQRIEGFLHPPATGAYTFWIAADDGCELWLSTDDSAANATRIAHHSGWTNSREWGKYPTQKSSAINLVAGQKYYVRALMKEGGDGDNLAVSWRAGNTANPANGDGSFIIPGSALSPRATAPAGGSGSITRAVWNNAPGVTLADIPTNRNPDSTGTVSTFEAPVNVANNYAQVIYGFITPAASGNYTFWIAGDDHVELKLSTDSSYQNATRIAHHTGWTASREWNKYSTQRSNPIPLVQGQRYYVEAWMKEGGGDDNLAVSWKLNDTTPPPNGNGSAIIPSSVLSPWVD